MKNITESFAVLLVGILSALIVFFIVQYNMIEDDNIIEDISYSIPSKKKAKEENVASYLDDMEKYTDVDVKVDPTKETNVNSVAIKSELTKDAISDTIEDKSKSTYMKNLEKYADTDVKEKVSKVKKEVVEKPKDNPSAKLPQETIDDELGMAIDAALDDL
jgi:hypothetical protein